MTLRPIGTVKTLLKVADMMEDDRKRTAQRAQHAAIRNESKRTR